MKCPVCKETNLAMTARQGIEIDYCPDCRGVWLDRGELDKFIEQAERVVSERRRGDSLDHPRGSEGHHRDNDDYRRRSRTSFLRDLFD